MNPGVVGKNLRVLNSTAGNQIEQSILRPIRERVEDRFDRRNLHGETPNPVEMEDLHEILEDILQDGGHFVRQIEDLLGKERLRQLVVQILLTESLVIL